MRIQKTKNYTPHMRKVLLILLFGSLLLLIIQYNTTSSPKSKKLRIVATTNIITDALQNICGEKADIETIIPHDTDPHSYTSTLQDNTKISSADFICSIGLHFEGALHTIIEKINKNFPEKVCILSKSLSNKETHKANPHYYLDPTLFAKAIQAASNKIQTLDPDNATYYKNNTALYRQALQELLQKGKKIIQSIPEKQRIVCMDHCTFEYAATAFDFKTHSLKGASSLAASSLYDRSSMTKIIIKNKLRAIFCEISKNKKTMQAIVNDCASQNHNVTCHTLNTDALQEGKTYKDLILDNLSIVAQNLS